MRKLTKHFGSYRLALYERDNNKTIMDLLDIGNFEVRKLATLIMLGNDCEEIEAYEILDRYLKESDENSLISAYFDLIRELDGDIKVLKTCGVNISELEKEFNKNTANVGKSV